MWIPLFPSVVPFTSRIFTSPPGTRAWWQRPHRMTVGLYEVFTLSPQHQGDLAHARPSANGSDYSYHVRGAVAWQEPNQGPAAPAARSCPAEGQQDSLLLTFTRVGSSTREGGQQWGVWGFRLHCWKPVRWTPFLTGVPFKRSREKGSLGGETLWRGHCCLRPPERLLLHLSSVINDFLGVWKPSVSGEGGSGLQTAGMEADCGGPRCVPLEIHMLKP